MISTLSPAWRGARAIESLLGRGVTPSHTTPAGLPKGYQWKPHDTGKRGRAALRRLRQRAALAAKEGTA